MEKLTLKAFAKYLQPRPRDWHKGNSGTVLIIGGDEGFPGAPRMAAEAALRVGAGLAIVATHPSHAATLNATRPEIISYAIKKVSQLKTLLKKADVIILGPGLGLSDWSKKIFQVAMQSTLPKVIDADALNLIAMQKKAKNFKSILTPHPGEAARLLKITPYDIQKNRDKAVQALQKKYGGVAILKGAGSLICTSTNAVAKCEYGNPGMATAGMGDVLSGVIGGLLAQGIPQEDAAKMGVLIHAIAGDKAAALGGERGMLATDLMPCLRQLMNPS